MQLQKANDYYILTNTLATHLQKCTSVNLYLQMRRYFHGRLETETVGFLCKQEAFYQISSVMGHT